jgi:hypothetical protein
MGRPARIALSISLIALIPLILLAACESERSEDSSPLLASFASDTTIMETESGAPMDSAIAGLLQKLGVPFDPKLASGGSGCELRGFARRADTLSSAPSVRCQMRGDDAEVVIEAAVSPEGWAERLFVRDPSASARDSALQTIELDVDEPFATNRVNLFTQDFDGDGVRELLLANFRGATGNFGYRVWRYDVASRRFTSDSAMSRMASPRRMEGRPCVRESWNSGYREHSGLVECFIAGRWVTMWESGTRMDERRRTVLRNLKVRLHDTLRVVRSDTLSRDLE